MTGARSLEQLQQAIRRHWLDIALSTRPIDRARAASAVQELYMEATGRPPLAVLFFDSPPQAEIASTFFLHGYPTQPMRKGGHGRRPVARIVAQRLQEAASARAQSLAEFDMHRLEGLLRTAREDAYRAGLDHSMFERSFDALCSQLSPKGRGALLAPWRRSKGWLRQAQRHAHWSVDMRAWMTIAGHHDFRQAAFSGQSPRAEARLMAAIAEVCRTCGPCWFYPDIAMVADRPSLLRLDAAWRLHSNEGPALAYRDGFSIHALHGVRVPRWVIDRPGRITAADVEKEPNAEVRRVLVERMGPQRYLSLSGAIAIARDEAGTLWRRSAPGGRGEARRVWCFVEVVNGTPEPDGSHKHYFLRVPPTMRAAREAVAWTYGLSAQAYQPHIRT